MKYIVLFYLLSFVIIQNEALKQSDLSNTPTSIFRISHLPISILNSNILIKAINNYTKGKNVTSLDPSKFKSYIMNIN